MWWIIYDNSCVSIIYHSIEIYLVLYLIIKVESFDQLMLFAKK